MLNTKVYQAPIRGCPCYTAIQQLSGWLGCHAMVHGHAQKHNITYTTMAYTRPDIYYTKPISTPSEMVADALYTNAITPNAMSDVLMVGAYKKVMTFLQTFRFLLQGKLVPGKYGFEARPMPFPATKSNTGGCLECLVSANVRLLHGIQVMCLNQWHPNRDLPSCSEYQIGNPTPIVFPHARIRPSGQPSTSCGNSGIPLSAPFCHLDWVGSRG